MEIVFIALVALVIWCGTFRYPPRYRNYRGPECGDAQKVQRDHLRLFTPPAKDSDEEDLS
ncbi:MAG: hypothetical protein U0804_01210 [Gemmataceae bacterium]